MNPGPLLSIAIEAATAAGNLLVRRFGRAAGNVSAKSSPTDLVSDADRAADELLREFLSSKRPDDGLVSEESSGRDSSTGLNWVVDPLDGTVNFLFGIPWWCVSVAVEDGEGALAGAIFDPNLDETFAAERGGGAFLNGEPITVSDVSDAAQALVGTGFGYDSERRRDQAEVVARVLPQVRDIRRMGSAALDLAALACGRLDAFYEAPLEHWDRAAGLLLVGEAGGRITALPGGSASSDGVIASGPRIHDALTAMIFGSSDGRRR